jgi:hypothetical protein
MNRKMILSLTKYPKTTLAYRGQGFQIFVVIFLRMGDRTQIVDKTGHLVLNKNQTDQIQHLMVGNQQQITEFHLHRPL